MNSKRKLVVVQVAALGYEFLRKHHGATWKGLTFRSAHSVFPALTCTVQASFRTATLPVQHGMIANGLFHRELSKPLFWEQSANQVQGNRIWQEFRGNGKTVALLFWQQSLGESVDILLSPAPIHKHHGGMIQDVYSQPPELYPQLKRKLRHAFNLINYWGPLASPKASRWIAGATADILKNDIAAPDLCFTYLPALDYDLQRYGPDHPKSVRALQELMGQLDIIRKSADANGYDLLIFGDYAIGNCTNGAVFPNRALYRSGLLSCRRINKALYADLHTSESFAMVDHEIAHVYIRDHSALNTVRSLLESEPGIGRILDRAQQLAEGVAHPNAGDLLLEAAEGCWLAYPWWNDPAEEPDYARHVDIHNKPGYDPCELFFGWPPGSVSRNTARIRGSHGRLGPGREVAWASTCFDADVNSLLNLAEQVKAWPQK